MRSSLDLWTLWLLLVVSGIAHAQQPPTPAQQLATCQEQLAASRGAVAKIHSPNAAFQAESLVTLDTKLGEAQQQQARDAQSIIEKQFALDGAQKQLTEAQAQQANDAGTITSLRAEVENFTRLAHETAMILGDNAVTIQALQHELETLKAHQAAPGPNTSPAKPEG